MDPVNDARSQMLSFLNFWVLVCFFSESRLCTQPGTQTLPQDQESGAHSAEPVSSPQVLLKQAAGGWGKGGPRARGQETARTIH